MNKRCTKQIHKETVSLTKWNQNMLTQKTVINAEPFQQRKTDKHTSLSNNCIIYTLRGFIDALYI